MSKICIKCGKNAYHSELCAIGMALRCSRTRGAALRIYRCPHRRVWHLTKHPTWTTTGSAGPVSAPGLGYRRQMAHILVQCTTVDESALVAIAAECGDQKYSVPAARAMINAWWHWGLVYPDGSTITAVDVEALREIATSGWYRWLASRSTNLVPAGGVRD